MTIYHAIKKLSEAGLVSDEYEECFPRRHFISLTEKSRRVAELLAQIEATLEEKMECAKSACSTVC